MASFHHRIKSGLKGAASEHARYIGRRGKFSDRTDLVHEAVGNLPAWADNILAFWKAADAHERANGAAYREHVIALPNELTREQNLDLALRLTEELVGNKTYQLAFHEPVGSVGGVANPHMHLMYSDRMNDGIERTPQLTFSRYNSKNPNLGGCRKDSGGRSAESLRDQVILTRKKIADIQNQALAEHGCNVSVDHRSLREQGKAKSPERHLGPARIKRMSDEQKRNLAVSRDSGPGR